jgi:hypothetical protein
LSAFLPLLRDGLFFDRHFSLPFRLQTLFRICKNIFRKHGWASTSISMSAISDIWHRHMLFRYRRQIYRTEKLFSDIGSVSISTSEFIPISDFEEKIYTVLQIWTRVPLNGKLAL